MEDYHKSKKIKTNVLLGEIKNMKINATMFRRITAIAIVIIALLGIFFWNILLWLTLIGILTYALFVDTKQKFRKASMWLFCFFLTLEVVGALSRSGAISLNLFGRNLFESAYMDVTFILSAILYVHMYMQSNVEGKIPTYKIASYILCITILGAIMAYGITGFTRDYEEKSIETIEHGDMVKIISTKDDKLLTADEEGNLYFAERNDTKNQAFTFEIDEYGFYVITDYKKRALDILGWKLNNNAIVGCWEDMGTINQKWFLYPTGEGTSFCVSILNDQFMLNNSADDKLVITTWSGVEDVFLIFEEYDKYKPYFCFSRKDSWLYIAIAVMSAISIAAGTARRLNIKHVLNMGD